MIAMTIKKEDLHKQLLPFRYKEVMVLSHSMEIDGKPEKGIYGLNGNNVFFLKYDDLPDEFEIGIPENLEEVETHLVAGEYLIQRLMLTPEIYITGIETNMSFDTAVRPLVILLSYYEERSKTIERMKYVD